VGKANGEYWHCLGIRILLPEFRQAFIIAKSTGNSKTEPPPICCLSGFSEAEQEHRYSVEEMQIIDAELVFPREEHVFGLVVSWAGDARGGPGILFSFFGRTIAPHFHGNC
jgi:hypothetical protein